MLKTWVPRGKHKGPANPQLIKRAQETTLQKDFVILIKVRLEHFCVCKSMLIRQGIVPTLSLFQQNTVTLTV